MMGDGNTFSGNVYMETPTGWEPVCALEDAPEVEIVEDEICETSGLRGWAGQEFHGEILVEQRQRRRIRRMLLGWKLPAPMRWRQIRKALRMMGV